MRTVLLRILFIALLYFLLGPAGRLLALGSWYGVPVWPSSGAVIAALLIWGRQYWPGVFLGGWLSAAVTLGVLDDSETWGQLVVSSTVAGAAAALNALLGEALIRRWGNFGRSFEHLHAMARLVVLGALPAVLGGSIGSVGIAVTAIMEWDDVPLLTLQWWLADTVGIFLVLPIVSIWRSEVAGAPRPTKWAVALPPVLILVGFAALFVLDLKKRQREIASDFMHDAAHRATQFQAGVARHLRALDVVDALMRSSTEVTGEEFRRFVATLREADAMLCVMAWVPRVAWEDRSAFEAQVRAEGESAFTIHADTTEPDGTDPREIRFHHPVRFVEPGGEWDAILGLDLGADRAMRRTLNDARDSGMLTLAPPQATRNNNLLGERCVLVKAHYAGETLPSTVEERRASLLGFNLCFFQLREALDLVLAPEEGVHLQVTLFEELPSGRVRVLSASNHPADEPPLPFTEFRGLSATQQLTYHRSMPVADRQWLFQVVPGEHYLPPFASNQAEILIVGGAFIAWLLAAVLMVLAGRNRRADHLVRERTSALYQEIDERIAAEQQRLKVIGELEQALAAIRTLEGLLPICASCKKIRDDKGYWTQIEAYVSRHSRAEFSHGICPDCLKALYPDFALEEDNPY